jgi:hyaluronoglucosaminidase
MQANKKHTTPLGIIEGFFGREWQWEDRTNYAAFLARHGYDFYIYAPKSDKHLRMQWQQDWPTATQQRLIELRGSYKDAGIQFGIGLSPHEIYRDNSRDQRQHLKTRIQQLNNLQPDILCILFDDMRGDIPGLADIQIDIAHEAAALSTASRIIFCPTYYSFDPVLEKVFGKMPDNYWQTFAQKLDSQIDIFWTGEKVCSPDYTREHLLLVDELIGRKPFLWDNYPVNDGAVKSNLLQLRAFTQSHAQLEGHVAGHAVNPMNQPWLSQIPLASLPLAYQQAQNYSPESAFTLISNDLCGSTLAQQLARDLAALQDRGLKNLSDTEQLALRHSYSQFHSNPFAQEIIDWLDGVYLFDPACLTE